MKAMLIIILALVVSFLVGAFVKFAVDVLKMALNIEDTKDEPFNNQFDSGGFYQG